MTIEDLRETLRDAVQAQPPGSANARQEVARRVRRQRLRIAATVGAPIVIVGVIAALAWPSSPRSVRLATRPDSTTSAPCHEEFVSGEGSLMDFIKRTGKAPQLDREGNIVGYVARPLDPAEYAKLIGTEEGNTVRDNCGVKVGEMTPEGFVRTAE